MPYLRMTIGRWSLDLDSDEAARIFGRIGREGAAIFQAQPGFISYRLMRADIRTTVAVAEWASEDLGTAGAQAFRDWLDSSGIARHLTLETYAGPIVAQSRTLVRGESDGSKVP